MKYEGMNTIQGEVRKSSPDAVYIRRKRYGSESSGGFFDKLFKQFLVTMAALIMLFSLNLIPTTRGFLEDVKEAVAKDYTQTVLSVFSED